MDDQDQANDDSPEFHWDGEPPLRDGSDGASPSRGGTPTQSAPRSGEFAPAAVLDDRVVDPGPTSDPLQVAQGANLVQRWKCYHDAVFRARCVLLLANPDAQQRNQ
jgi:hypothetical protein